MPHGPLSADRMLGVKLSAIMSRNRYTIDPGSVVDELRATAGDRTDILAMEVGTWVGFYETEKYSAVLIEALRTLPDLEPWIAVGRQRFNDGRHTTQGFAEPGRRDVLGGP